MTGTLVSPRVAVLLATYRGERYVSEQIESLARQRGVVPTIIWRDDNSEDGTVKIVKQASREYGVVTVILSTENVRQGSAGANFMTIARAVDPEAFDYFAFCDQDDIWEASKLERAILCISRTTAACYSSNLTAFDANSGKRWMVVKSQPMRDLDYVFQGASAGCTYVLNREAFVHVQSVVPQQGFPVWASHDWFVYAACRTRGFKWVFDDQSHILYRQHDGNAFGALPGLRGVVARLRYARTGWYRRHILWLASILAYPPEAQAAVDAVRAFGLRDRAMLIHRLPRLRRSLRDRFFLGATIAMGAL